MAIRDTANEYGISLSQGPFLIIGLGNIGDEYKLTRHNVGFMILDKMVNSLGLGDFSQKSDLNASIIETVIGGEKVIFAKPTTFMNKSGLAVLKLQNYFAVNDPRILVVHDDVDVDFAAVKSRLCGGNAGHNGLKSIEQAIGDQFARIRVGTRNEHLENTDTADFVLANFSRTEQQSLEPIIDYSIAQITNFIEDQFSDTSSTVKL